MKNKNILYLSLLSTAIFLISLLLIWIIIGFYDPYNAITMIIIILGINTFFQLMGTLSIIQFLRNKDETVKNGQ